MLAKQLAVLRLSDVEKLEKVLKLRQQKKARKGNIMLKSSRLFKRYLLYILPTKGHDTPIYS